MNAQQLKNSILQMAVQGKLVPQDPSDEPASVLLERIRAEKQRLVKEGKIKADKKSAASDNLPYGELPFDVPEGWVWTTLGEVFNLQAGKFVKADNIYAESQNRYPCYGGNGLRGYVNSFNRDGAFQLVGRQGALCGNVNFADGKFHATEHAVVVEYFCGTDVNWIGYFLTALNLNQYSTATAQPGLAVSTINKVAIPLPPLAEQRRIVARIEELLPHIAAYDAAEQTLTALNTDFPADLKKSILQSAVQGKLVEQDASDEPASVLLERIREERQKLIKAGKIKRDKSGESVIFRRDNSHYEIRDGEEVCIDEELPFEIPATWEWIHLDEVCEYIQRGKSPKYSPIRKYPVIAQKCNQWSGFSIDQAQFIEPESISSYTKERILQDRDLLWNSTGLGTLGRMVIFKTELNPYELAVADSHVTVIRPLKDYVLSEFLYSYFANPTVQTVIESQSDGTTKQKELATSTVKGYYVPLPPLAEQHRIINKMEELLTECAKIT